MEARQGAARLNVILAREAPVGVVFRRGPRRLVQVIKWQTDTDGFEAGQWFKGVIYDCCADLSPDGRYLIYFAAKYGQRPYPWTAISRPPYLTALALWFKACSSDGGGVFESRSELWLNHPPEEAKLDPDTSLPGWFRVRAECGDGAEPIWFRRLGLSGWEQVSPGEFEFAGRRGCRARAPMTWRRVRPRCRQERDPDARGGLTTELRMYIGTRDGARKLGFEVATADGERVQFDADWADWDHAGRLVLARGGAILVAEMQADGTLGERQLADFNANRFEEVIAPEWAREW